MAAFQDFRQKKVLKWLMPDLFKSKQNGFINCQEFAFIIAEFFFQAKKLEWSGYLKICNIVTRWTQCQNLDQRYNKIYLYASSDSFYSFLN